MACRLDLGGCPRQGAALGREQVDAVALTFVDDAGITRVKTVDAPSAAAAADPEAASADPEAASADPAAGPDA